MSLQSSNALHMTGISNCHVRESIKVFAQVGLSPMQTSKKLCPSPHVRLAGGRKIQGTGITMHAPGNLHQSERCITQNGSHSHSHDGAL